MRLLVVIPTFNERGNIEPLVDEVLKNAPHGSRILIVDDHSPDGTGEIADRLAGERKERIAALHRPSKQGLGSALLTGFQYGLHGGFDWLLTIDADFSHDPAEIPRLLEATATADLVIGSRHLSGGGYVGWKWLRRLLHWIATHYAKLASGIPVGDQTNNFKCYRASMLRELPLKETLTPQSGFVGHTLLLHAIYKKGFRVREVPSTFGPRRYGESKMSLREILHGLWELLKKRAER